MSESKVTRASCRLEQVRAGWGITGAKMAEELDVKQPTASRLLNGLLSPGRDLIFKIQALYLVPAMWWVEEPVSDETEPLPSRPDRYGPVAVDDAVQGVA